MTSDDQYINNIIGWWNDITAQFSIPSTTQEIVALVDQSSFQSQQLKIDILKRIGCDQDKQIILEWYFELITCFYKNTLANDFWNLFKGVLDSITIDNEKVNKKQSKLINQQFTLSINFIYKVFIYFENNINLIYNQFYNNNNNDNDNNDNSNNVEYKQLIKKLQDILLASLTLSSKQTNDFNKILYIFFERDFISFSKPIYFKLFGESLEDDEIDQEENEDNDEQVDSRLDDSINEIKYKENSFMDLCQKLHTLNFIIISEDIFTQILFKKIYQHIEKICRDIFDKRLLAFILDCQDQVMFKWLGMILCHDDNEFYANIFQHWKTRLEFSIYEHFSEQRISQLFDMIVQYPDSIPALEDLSVCYNKISIQKTLISSLIKVVYQRLLHPGANTNDIITQYISTIASMKIIDSTGVVLEAVGRPIRTYLAQREDTIRCIVTSFTDEESEIYQEFSNIDSLDIIGKQEIKDDHFIDDNNDDFFDEKQIYLWKPSQSIIENNNNNEKNNNNNNLFKDTISSLVNIYDSPELFVNEYRNMLSDRLLSLRDYNLDKEIKNVELLKLRFGENSMHNCEVMIKDISDSKRLNTQIKKTINDTQENPISFETLIISRLFWPSIKEEEFEYHPSIREYMEQFSKEYSRIKAPRELIWKKHMGFVDLEIELNGKTIEYSVSPIQASILLYFQQLVTISIDRLSSLLKVGNKDIIRKKLVFWLNNQVIKEIDQDQYTINNQEFDQVDEDDDNSDNSEDDSGQDEKVTIMEEEEDQQESASAREKEEQMRVIEKFIIGMLTNFKALPLDRMHSMLSMFNAEQYTSTSAELKSFLSKLINEEKIELSGLNYQIKK
ncbi:hypothetical protein CYY_000825 [Polysphondylium violaceum]|uniref:Anaphase-promoting complex subunit 2 n=1 Tax=Polysphondylium violaceum TaxID=133409 RepID=A0A8J4V578_9MYCE|nr:hypothetical protein CYY_000825 [Polysphondylium violaceum]